MPAVRRWLQLPQKSSFGFLLTRCCCVTIYVTCWGKQVTRSFLGSLCVSTLRPAATTAENLFASPNEIGEQQKSHRSFSVVFTDISGSSLCGATKLFWVKFQMCYFLDAQSVWAKASPPWAWFWGLFPLRGRSSSLLLPSTVHRGSSECWGLCLQY